MSDECCSTPEKIGDITCGGDKKEQDKNGDSVLGLVLDASNVCATLNDPKTPRNVQSLLNDEDDDIVRNSKTEAANSVPKSPLLPNDTFSELLFVHPTPPPPPPLPLPLAPTNQVNGANSGRKRGLFLSDVISKIYVKNSNTNTSINSSINNSSSSSSSSSSVVVNKDSSSVTEESESDSMMMMMMMMTSPPLSSESTTRSPKSNEDPPSNPNPNRRLPLLRQSDVVCDGKQRVDMSKNRKKKQKKTQHRLERLFSQKTGLLTSPNVGPSMSASYSSLSSYSTSSSSLDDKEEEELEEEDLNREGNPQHENENGQEVEEEDATYYSESDENAECEGENEKNENNAANKAKVISNCFIHTVFLCLSVD